MFSFIHFYFEVTKISEFFRKRNMSRRMYQGGSSVKKGPRIAIREQDDELPRDAEVRACEWPSDDFMVEAGLRRNLTRMCVMPIWRTSYKISVLNTIN